MDTHISHGSEAWRLARFRHVTATDIGTIMGLNSRCSRVKLLKAKRNGEDTLKDASPELKVILSLGKNFESTALQAFLRWRALRNEDTEGFIPTMHADKYEPYVTGSPDFLIPGAKVVVEIKTHWGFKMDRATPYENVCDISLPYYLQIQAYLNIMEWEEGYLVSWTLVNGFTVYSVTRDAVLWKKCVIPIARQFHSWLDSEIDGRALKDVLSLAIVRRDEKDYYLSAVHSSMMAQTVKLK